MEALACLRVDTVDRHVELSMAIPDVNELSVFGSACHAITGSILDELSNLRSTCHVICV